MNNPSQESQAWDVMAAETQADVLWFAYGAARQLADRHARAVRLFVGSMSRLGASLPQVDSRLWLQDLNGVQILDARLADVCLPSRNLLQIFGTRIPSGYADRFAASRTPRRWYRVARLGATEHGLGVKQAHRTSGCVVYDVEQGEIPEGAGLLKDRRDHRAMRTKWTSEPRARETTLRLVGLQGPVTGNSLTVFMHVDNPRSIAMWLEALKTSDVAIRFLIAGTAPEALAEVGVNIVSGKTISFGNLSVALLPEMPWHLQDEVVWASDLILTSCESMAVRAVASGCPLMWCGQVDRGTSNLGESCQHSVRRWYAARADAPLKLLFAQTSAALKTGGGVIHAWREIVANLPELRAHAERIAELIVRSPNTMDVIIGSSTKEGHDGQPMRISDFAPTQPGIGASPEDEYFRT